MGWRLAEEIAWARPERPGPEWWTLLDIAQDARDETRQSMCGQAYLMARGKCSKATLYRRLEALRKAGLLVAAGKPAPGMRAVYEIPVIHTLPGTGLTIAETRTGVTNAETRSPVDNPGTGLTIAETRLGPNGSQNGAQRVSKSPPTGLSVSETPPVRDPVITPPSLPKLPVADGSLEVTGPAAREPSGEIRHPTKLERAALNAVAESRTERGAS